MVAQTVEQAVAILQRTPSALGASVFEHLAEVILEILQKAPENAVDLLETSLLTKRARFKPLLRDRSIDVKERPNAEHAEAALGLFRAPAIPIDPETKEPAVAAQHSEFAAEDALGAAGLFKALGAGLGRPELYRAHLAAAALGTDPEQGVAAVRFFGKVLGTGGDYYVFEVTPEEATVGAGEINSAYGPSKEVPNEKGTGINAFAYYVASHLGKKPTRLPDATPAGIRAARRLKRFLTGHLDAPVSAFPPFPGREADYLRAQIARIAANTTVCPTGRFVLGEEGTAEKNEDWGPPGHQELASPASWCHRYPHINAQGRCVAPLAELPEGEDVQETPEPEAGPPLLAPLDGDAPLAGGFPAWTCLASSTQPRLQHQVSGVRSNLWPGAVAATSGVAFAGIYVGWAIKAGPFAPAPPPLPAAECAAAYVECVELPLRPAPKLEGEEGGSEEE